MFTCFIIKQHVNLSYCEYTLTQNRASTTLNVTHVNEGKPSQLNLFCVLPDSSCLLLECGSHISGGIAPLMLSEGAKPLWSLETTTQLA